MWWDSGLLVAIPKNTDEKPESTCDSGDQACKHTDLGPRLLQWPKFLYPAPWETCWHQQDWGKMTFTVVLGGTSEGASGIKWGL